MGIVVNGEVDVGENYFAGEIGHLLAIKDGSLCYCGRTGCLETVSSESYILSGCKKGLEHGVNSSMTKACEGRIDELSIEHVIEAAKNGDRLARNKFEQVGIHIGMKLSDIAIILNPKLIILGGPVIDGNQFLFETIERIVINQTHMHTAETLQLIHYEKKCDMRLKGVSSTILMDYFNQ